MDQPQAKNFRFVRGLGEELVILDEEHDVAHQLDADAVAVWRACDGNSSPFVIAAKTGLGTRRVQEVLLQLESLQMLVPTEPTVLSLETRRRVLHKIALTGVGVAGLPAVMSVVMPTPAQAFNSGPGSTDNGGPGPGGTGGPASTGDGSVGATTTASDAGSTPAQSSSLPKKSTTPSHRASKGTAKGSQATPHASSTSTAPDEHVGAETAGATGAGAGAGSSRTAGGRLPFTGLNVLREAVIGVAALAGGIGGRLRLRERRPKSE